MSPAPDTVNRRKPGLRQWLLSVGIFLLGVMILFAGRAAFISRDDLSEVAGRVREVQQRHYWEDRILYVTLEGTTGRFKIEDDWPGYSRFLATVEKGSSVRMWVDNAARDLDQPAVIFHADVGDEAIVQYSETSAVHNTEACYVMLLGPIFCFAGFWIWVSATRRIPGSEEVQLRQAETQRLRQKHSRLFAVVEIVDAVRRWGEEIPKFGDLFTAFLFFWIFPLYLVFLKRTATTWKRVVAAFCNSYWVLLICLSVATFVVADFPGGDEYPALGPPLSRLFNVYLLMNLAYGAAIWIAGMMMHGDEESQNAATLQG